MDKDMKIIRAYRRGSYTKINICRKCDLVTEHTKCVECGDKTESIQYYKIAD